jgi:uncharacterized protein YacL (UPF0231 family)
MKKTWKVSLLMLSLKMEHELLAQLLGQEKSKELTNVPEVRAFIATNWVSKKNWKIVS